MEAKYLKPLLESMTCLTEIMQDDMAIIVYDLIEFKILAFKTSGVLQSLDLKPGDSFAIEGRPAFQSVIKDKKQIASLSPRNSSEEPTKVLLTPILNEKEETVAAVAVIKSTEVEMKVEDISLKLFNYMEQLNAGVEEIASSSQQLAIFIKEIVNFSEQTKDKLREIDGIIRDIKKISKQSNLLALNASIEAARAGDAGRGFHVVAKEMGNLSGLSKNSADKVAKSLSEMKSAIETIVQQINQTGMNSENQAAAIEEIAATTDEVVGVTKHLSDIAKIDTVEEALARLV